MCESAGPKCMNRQCYVDFLDWRLKLDDKENMVEENLFICFSSLPMVAIYRLMSVFYLTFCIPLMLIRGNSHGLSDHGWLVHSNGYVIDILEQKMIVLEDNSKKIIEEYFMMNLCDTFMQELPPLKECLDYLHT